MADDKKVFAPVLWDNDNTFQNGKKFTINANAVVIGITQKPTGISIPAFTVDIPLQDTLQIKDATYNNLYLDLTLAEWAGLVGEATSSADGTKTFTLVGGASPTCSIVSSDFSNITIISINKGGITIYAYSYTDNGTSSSIDFAASGCLTNGETLQIIYKSN